VKARPRLLPIVIGAASGLLLLKLVGAVAGDGTVSGAAPALAEAQTAAQAEAGVAYSQGNSRSADSRGMLLERLGERREELDGLEAQLRERENLLEAAEKRVEERIAELARIEARINAAMKVRDEEEKARFEGLIKMYAAMKPKDAARIFNRLDMGILTEVAARMNPELMGPILSQMAPEAAERLTAALAEGKSRPQVLPAEGGAEELPKIVGKPPGA